MKVLEYTAHCACILAAKWSRLPRRAGAVRRTPIRHGSDGGTVDLSFLCFFFPFLLPRAVVRWPTRLRRVEGQCQPPYVVDRIALAARARKRFRSLFSACAPRQSISRPDAWGLFVSCLSSCLSQATNLGRRFSRPGVTIADWRLLPGSTGLEPNRPLVHA